MIGKTLYWARIRNDKVEVLPHTILKKVNSNEHGPRYKLDGGKYLYCATYEVGKVMFLTKQEAIDALIKKLEHSIKMGEEYVAKEKSHLMKAKKLNPDKIIGYQPHVDEYPLAGLASFEIYESLEMGKDCHPEVKKWITIKEGDIEGVIIIPFVEKF